MTDTALNGLHAMEFYYFTTDEPYSPLPAALEYDVRVVKMSDEERSNSSTFAFTDFKRSCSYMARPSTSVIQGKEYVAVIYFMKAIRIIQTVRCIDLHADEHAFRRTNET
jgi:hypothetical protein